MTITYKAIVFIVFRALLLHIQTGAQGLPGIARKVSPIQPLSNTRSPSLASSFISSSPPEQDNPQRERWCKLNQAIIKGSKEFNNEIRILDKQHFNLDEEEDIFHLRQLLNLAYEGGFLTPPSPSPSSFHVGMLAAKAVEIYGSLLYCYPKNKPSLWSKMAVALDLMGDEKQAIEAIERAIKTNQGIKEQCPFTLLRLGRMWREHELSRPTRINNTLQTAVRIFKEEIIKRDGEGMKNEEVNKLLAADQGIWQAYRELGLLHADPPVFDPKRAVYYFKKALNHLTNIRSNTQNGSTATSAGLLRMHTGIAYSHLGRQKIAMRYMKRAAKDIPSNPILRAALAKSSSPENESLGHRLKDQGLRFFHDAEAHLDHVYDHRHRTATSVLRDTRKLLKKGLRLFPHHLDMHHKMGLILLALENIGGAKRFWKFSFKLSHTMSPKECLQFR